MAAGRPLNRMVPLVASACLSKIACVEGSHPGYFFNFVKPRTPDPGNRCYEDLCDSSHSDRGRRGSRYRGTGRSRWPPHLRWAAHPVDGNSAWSANWSISPWSQRNRKLKGPPCIALMVHLPGQSRIMTLEQVKELLKKGSDH